MTVPDHLAERVAGTPPTPTLVYSAAGVRELDKRLINMGEQSASAAFRLMERAGAAMFQHIRRHWPAARELLIYCGTGNNGGDGYVIAGLARAAGWRVRLVQVGDPARATPETSQAMTFARLGGVEPVLFDQTARRSTPGAQAEANTQGPSSSDPSSGVSPLRAAMPTATCVVVDALLGTGFRAPLRADFAHAVHLINHSGLPVMAADIPSGLNADTGTAGSGAVNAALTVTVIGRKQGLYTGAAADHVGRLIYEPLVDTAEWRAAACDRLSATARLINADLLSGWLPRRARTAHKGRYGQVLVVGGDRGMGGAPVLAAQAVARSGAGKTVLMSRAEHVSAMLARQPEVMTVTVNEAPDSAAMNALITAQVSIATVVVLGPGLGQSIWSRTLFAMVMRAAAQASVPLVLDADALNLMAEDLPAILALADRPSRSNWILTPHPGEAARLLGCSTADIEQDRFQAVRRLQHLVGANCLLKGAGSLMAFAAPPASQPAEELLDICTDGNPGMASGGMGDVLAGMAGGLLAQRLSAADALRAAVCMHARAADMAVEQQGEQGLLASDLLAPLSRLWVALNRTQKESS